jgi:hypothetical protein
MAGGGGHGESSTHIRMYEFKWLGTALGVDSDDRLLGCGLEACGEH